MRKLLYITIVVSMLLARTNMNFLLAAIAAAAILLLTYL